jgi:NAD(P)H-flavin reductase
MPEDWSVPWPLRVARVRRETGDVATLELTPASSFAFAAGQFNMLCVFGLGEVAISISGDPAKGDRIVHTIRAVGAVSGALTRLRRDAVVGVRGPYGSAWPVAEAEGSDVVIIAGGLGLAPLRPAMYSVLGRRQHYGRIILLYGRAARPISFIDASWRLGGVGSISTSRSPSTMLEPIGAVMSASFRH